MNCYMFCHHLSLMSHRYNYMQLFYGIGSFLTFAVRFSFNYKLFLAASSSLTLSDAMWPVFESRGAVKYGSYSIPRQFEPVAQTGNIENIVNMGSFHRTEVSTYNEDPCPQDGEFNGVLEYMLLERESKTGR